MDRDAKPAKRMVWSTRDFTVKEPAAKAASRPRSAVLLIVDDDPAVHEAVRVSVPPGCSVVGILGGERFIEMVEAYRPDLVILDVRLPGDDGFQLCRRLRAHPRFGAVPVLLLTGVLSEEWYWSLLESGGDAYLTKPFEPKQLRETLSRLLA